MRLVEKLVEAWSARAPLGPILHVVKSAHAPPSVTPRRFVEERLRRPGRAVAVVVGASFVHGRLGANFVDMLAERLGHDRFQLVNAGHNGDLAYNVRARLDEVIACDPDEVVVLVGTNDVLAGLSAVRAWEYRRVKHLPDRPTLASYRENVRGIVATLRERSRARVALCSLPFIGERLDSPLNRRVEAYNAVVREVAEAEGVVYVPVHERLREALARDGMGSRAKHGGDRRLFLTAPFQRYLLGWSWSAISEVNGMRLLADGVHVNERGASIIAETIERALRADMGNG